MIASVDLVEVEEPLHLFHSVSRPTMSAYTNRLPCLQSPRAFLITPLKLKAEGKVVRAELVGLSEDTRSRQLFIS